jgi:general secretion pathway protein B
MSYILDALKKSEAERSRGSVPTLLIPAQTQFRSSVAIWVLLGALIVNACLFAAWMFWPTAPIAPSPTVPAVASPPESTTANDRTASRVNLSPPQAAVQAVENPPPPSYQAEKPDVETTPATRVDPISGTTSENVPTPTYSFSTHVYATDPSMRAVTMGGRRFVEGDTIGPGVTIKEITESGVVLDINGRTVPIDVLQDWR